MRFISSVNEGSQLVIPQQVMETLHLEVGARVNVEVSAVSDETPYVFDPERFDQAIKRYTGSLRDQFLAQGWTSVDAYMDEIRPRW
jgi:bifunctional DNA-binding transcriptional regulator/antitoxin component of YhaV-PrlF toxin-antitoxin module